MARNKWGRIINIASIASGQVGVGIVGGAHYTASKCITAVAQKNQRGENKLDTSPREGSVHDYSLTVNFVIDCHEICPDRQLIVKALLFRRRENYHAKPADCLHLAHLSPEHPHVNVRLVNFILNAYAICGQRELTAQAVAVWFEKHCLPNETTCLWLAQQGDGCMTGAA